jgi:hypothetical protein
MMVVMVMMVRRRRLLVVVVVVVQEDLTHLLFFSHVSIAHTYAHMFLTLSTNYDILQSTYHYPIPEMKPPTRWMSVQSPTRWVYEWEDPQFYTMLVQEWETTLAWTDQTLQDYKAELLRVRGLNVMSTTKYQIVSQMGVFPFV